MNSIRWSLLVYLLLLLAFALTAFSILTYENASERLGFMSEGTHRLVVARAARTYHRLEEGYQATKRTVEVNFDAKLLLQAQTFAGHLGKQTFSPERYNTGIALALFDLGIQAPSGVSPLVFQLAHKTNLATNGMTRVSRILNPVPLQLIGDDFLRPRVERVSDTYVVRGEHGEILLYSPHLGDDELLLPEEASELNLLDAHFETVQFKSGQKVRVVTLLAPVTRRLEIDWMPNQGRRYGYDANTYRPRMRTYLRPLDPREVERGNTPRIFVQYARPLTEVDEVLGEMRSDLIATRDALEREQEEILKELDEETRVALASLRTKLVIISACTFALTALGGVWLVGRGLAPLRRIANAVSQVTAQNLHLPLTRDQVPQETAIIVEKLQETLASLERTFAREKQALADISHDLRTPITALLTTAQVCLRKERTPAQYRQALESCTDIGQQLGGLVERLLALARLDAGVDTYQPEMVDVPEIAEHCVTLVRPLAQANNLTLAFERNGPVVAKADANKLREVLVNLLDNAIQYNRPGGRVDVAVSRDNGHVEVAVHDTGIGIPSEKQARLFERFYRADPSRASSTVHAGLGLAIVKGYVELMGGSVTVDSVEGEGSTFRVRLPVEPATANG